MNLLLDNKFKDVPPLDTVHKIRSILHGLGLSTIDRWTDSQVQGCYSLRVEIAGTGVGQNGKGATPEFALASAYAELMERMQNDLLYTGDYDAQVWAHGGFYYAPDEKLINIQELARQDNPWVDCLLDEIRQYDQQLSQAADPISLLAARLGAAGDASQAKCRELKQWRFSRPDGCDHDFVALPFCDLQTGAVYHMPVAVLRAVYATNGTCAGNTPQEALLQGLAEILERHANTKIVRQRLTPPTIPDDYLRQYPYLYRIIRQIEGQGNYKVVIKDCSLGSGFPVVAAVLVDLTARSYLVKFGAHPIFPMALERTLTEMFQGRNLAAAAKTVGIAGGFDLVGGPDNLHNILKSAAGQYPEQFFAPAASYDFIPFVQQDQQDNEQLLKFATDQLLQKGYQILIRDVSYLGFPSYQIVVPGYSEIFNFGSQRLREKSSLDAAKATIRHLPRATDEQIQKLVRYLTYKRSWILENSLEFSAGLPLKFNFPGGNLAFDFLRAACHYRLGQLDQSYRIFSYVASYMQTHNDPDWDYYAGLRDYTGALARGMGHRETADLLQNFYAAPVIRRIAQQLGKPQDVLKQLYEPLDCFNCGACKARNRCHYDGIKNMRLKLKDRQLAHGIEQGI